MPKNIISHCLKPLNRKAENIFFKIIEGVKWDAAKYIGEKGKAFMQVVVKRIPHDAIYGKVYAVGHYYTQMGDRMSDPEMTFLVNTVDGRVYPLSFEQHGTFATYETSAVFKDGEYVGKYKKMNNDHKNFANGWMENIKHQQSL